MSCELRRAAQTVSDVLGLPVFSRRDTDVTVCLGVVGREDDGGACGWIDCMEWLVCMGW